VIQQSDGRFSRGRPVVVTAKQVQGTLCAALTSTIAACALAPPATAQLSVPPAPITSYVGDPGRLGDPASWRTPEFLRDNGMLSIGAEFAYASGYSGTGTNTGIVDSGVFAGHVREHGSQDTGYTVGDRYHSVEAQGGDTGPTPGFYDPAFNDTHGTHVSGTVGASRDGVGETQPLGPEANMHGVAFNTDAYFGNTHKTDGVFYGRLPDNATPAQTPDNAYLANVSRAPRRASASTRPGATCPRRTASRTRTARPSTGSTARSRSRAPARSFSSPPATAASRTRRRAGPRRTSCPTSRAAGTRRPGSTRTSDARSTPTGPSWCPASRSSTSAASRSGRA